MPTIHTQLYNILEVSPNASIDEIKKAFRRLAVKYHPDKHTDETDKTEAGIKFKDISRAYDVLSDPERRMKYDATGDEDGDESRPNDGNFPFPFPFFAAQREPKATPVKVKLNVTLEEIYRGKDCTVNFECMRICRKCSGKGGTNSNKCNKCRDGYVTTMNSVGRGMYQQIRSPCSGCKGKAFVCESVCETCDGEKIIPTMITETITVNPGTEDGETIVLENKGHELPSRTKAVCGDVVVIVEVQKHPSFSRKGRNLYHHVDLPLAKALCGGKVVVEHLDGHQIVLELDEVIRPDQSYYVNGEGMPKQDCRDDRGDLIVNFNVVYPETLDQSAKEALKMYLNWTNDDLPVLMENHYITKLRPYTEDKTQEQDSNDDSTNATPNVQCAQQ